MTIKQQRQLCDRILANGGECETIESEFSGTYKMYSLSIYWLNAPSFIGRVTFSPKTKRANSAYCVTQHQRKASKTVNPADLLQFLTHLEYYIEEGLAGNFNQAFNQQ